MYYLGKHFIQRYIHNGNNPDSPNNDNKATSNNPDNPDKPEDKRHEKSDDHHKHNVLESDLQEKFEEIVKELTKMDSSHLDDSEESDQIDVDDLKLARLR